MANRSSFEPMYREMLPSVYRFCTARLGTTEGEDVTSETFHAAAKAYKDGQEERVTPAWLMAVARNKVIDRWRKAERRQRVAQLLQPLEVDLVSLPQSWSTDPRHEDVMATLDSITDRHRTLLILHYVDGMRIAEIASTLDSTTSAVESALARARGSFRRNYAKVTA